MERIAPAEGVNIKDFDPQVILAFKYWRMTEKIDGVKRLFYKTSSNKVLAYSKTGIEDVWLTHISSWLEQPHFPNNMVYDCELVDRDLYFDNEVDSFILRTETNAKASQEYPDNKGDLMAICHDMFRPGGDLSTGRERTTLLQNTFLGIPLSEPIAQINILGYIYGAHESIISSLMDMVCARKGEGLMLLNIDAPYIPKRTTDLVKVKRLNEYIGTIINYDMGRDDSKIAGGIAALICEVDGCSVPVRVGTGFSNNLRKELATDKILGSKIEIESFGKSRDRHGDVSLSMPVFKQFVSL